MAYNIILERPWIHKMGAIPLILYQVIKFLSKWGIRQIRGDQRATREINSIVIFNELAKIEDDK